MKKFLALVGTASILLPSAAFAGSLTNTNGVSAMRSTAAGFSNSNIEVYSDIAIDNEVHIESENYSAAVDMTAENARVGYREAGHAHYNEAAGGGAAGGELAAEGEYLEADASGDYSASDTFSETVVQGEGTLNADFVAEDSFALDEEAQWSADGEGKVIPFFAAKGDVSSEESLFVSEESESFRDLDVAVDFEGSGTTIEESSNVDAGGSVAYQGGEFEAEGETAGTGSYTAGGWRGMQSEQYLDGSLSASLSGGWTAVNGTIKEDGYTQTTVEIESFEANNDFGKSASSFSSVSF